MSSLKCDGSAGGPRVTGECGLFLPTLSGTMGLIVVFTSGKAGKAIDSSKILLVGPPTGAGVNGPGTESGTQF